MRILVADDERDLNALIAEKLKKEHYSVDCCYDGEEALEYLGMAEYDAVVLDIMMPKKDGISVLKELRANGSHVPVLLLTAKDSVEDRVLGLDAGADDYLIKPFAYEELMARLRVLLRSPLGRRSDPASGYASGAARRQRHYAILQGICAAQLYDAECRHGAQPRAAGTAHLEL